MAAGLDHITDISVKAKNVSLLKIIEGKIIELGTETFTDPDEQIGAG